MKTTVKYSRATHPTHLTHCTHRDHSLPISTLNITANSLITERKFISNSKQNPPPPHWNPPAPISASITIANRLLTGPTHLQLEPKPLGTHLTHRTLDWFKCRPTQHTLHTENDPKWNQFKLNPTENHPISTHFTHRTHRKKTIPPSLIARKKKLKKSIDCMVGHLEKNPPPDAGTTPRRFLPPPLSLSASNSTPIISLGFFFTPLFFLSSSSSSSSSWFFILFLFLSPFYPHRPTKNHPPLSPDYSFLYIFIPPLFCVFFPLFLFFAFYFKLCYTLTHRHTLTHTGACPLFISMLIIISFIIQPN